MLLLYEVSPPPIIDNLVLGSFSFVLGLNAQTSLATLEPIEP